MAYRIAALLREKNSAAVVQAWFQGVNPRLDDVAPARLLREGDLEQVGPRCPGGRARIRRCRMTSAVTGPPQLVVVDAAEQVWRVGFKPEPWAGSGAGADGRFHGRWDDRQGNFRTIYAGSTVLGGASVSSKRNADRSFCAVTAAESIAALRPRFVALAHLLNQHHVDAAALKDGRPRASPSPWPPTCTPRPSSTASPSPPHGDDLALWAIFERAEEIPRSVAPSTTRAPPALPRAPGRPGSPQDPRAHLVETLTLAARRHSARPADHVVGVVVITL